MCDWHEKDHKGKTKSSKPQQLKHHHQMKAHQHYQHQSDDNESINTQSTTDDSFFSDRPNHRHTTHLPHPHHHHPKQNHRQVSLSATSLISSSSSSSSTSSSSSSSSSTSSSFSSSTTSLSSSSFTSSSTFSSRSSSRRHSLGKPQHSQSCTDISGKHWHIDEDDDTESLIHKQRHPNRPTSKENTQKGKSSHNPSSPLNRGQVTSQDAGVRKAKSMEALTSVKADQEHGNESKEKQDERKSEARKNLMKEKIKFSAFLNEITRQVLSPMRLTTLGVTDAQRPCSPARSRKVDSSIETPRQQGSRRASVDSASSTTPSQSSRHSHSTQRSQSKSLQNHSCRSSNLPHEMCCRPKSCSDISCSKAHLSGHHDQRDHHISAHHHHHHYGDCKTKSHHYVPRAATHHHYNHQHNSCVDQRRDHHGHHGHPQHKDQYAPTQYNDQYHHENHYHHDQCHFGGMNDDHVTGDHVPFSGHHVKAHQQSQGAHQMELHHHHHTHHQHDREHHHRTNHAKPHHHPGNHQSNHHQHCGKHQNTSLPCYHGLHGNEQHKHHHKGKYASHNCDHCVAHQRYLQPQKDEAGDKPDHQEHYRERHHHHGNHRSESCHQSDRHTESQPNQDGECPGETCHHRHRKARSVSPHHHPGDHHSKSHPHHHGHHPTESHVHRHGHPHSETHHQQPHGHHHNKSPSYHQGEKSSETHHHHHGDHQSESHPSNHGDNHNKTHHHHQGAHHEEVHHHGNNHTEVNPAHHGDHTSKSHSPHHGDHIDVCHDNLLRDKPSKAHHHRLGCHHGDPQEYGQGNHQSKSRLHHLERPHDQSHHHHNHESPEATEHHQKGNHGRTQAHHQEAHNNESPHNPCKDLHNKSFHPRHIFSHRHTNHEGDEHFHGDQNSPADSPPDVTHKDGTHNHDHNNQDPNNADHERRLKEDHFSSHEYHHGEHHNESQQSNKITHIHPYHQQHQGDVQNTIDLKEPPLESHCNEAQPKLNQINQDGVGDHLDQSKSHLSAPPLPLMKPETLFSSLSLQEEEQTSFTTASLRKETASHELGHIMVIKDPNEGLHQCLLKTAVRMEFLGEEFISSQKLLETELQRTRLELSTLTDRFKRLHDDCSSSQQTNDLLEKTLHSVSQSMEQERERLHRRISELTEKLLKANFTKSTDEFSEGDAGSDTIHQALHITPPPAEFMDSHSHDNAKPPAQEHHSLGSVPEEEESDWSEMGEEVPQFILAGSNRCAVWRHPNRDLDRDSESGGEEIIRGPSPFPKQIPCVQFTIHQDILPPLHSASRNIGLNNISDSLTGEGSYKISTSPTFESTFLIRSASLEEISLTGHHMPKELKGTEAMMDLHQSSEVLSTDSDNEIIHHWRTNDAVIKMQIDDLNVEADHSLSSLQSAEQMLKHFMSDLKTSEGTPELHVWRNGIPEEVLKGERTQL